MLTAYLNKISRNPFGCGRFFVRVNLVIFKKAWFIYIKLPIFAKETYNGQTRCNFNRKDYDIIP